MLLQFKIKVSLYPYTLNALVGKDICKVVKIINRKQHRKGNDKYTASDFENVHGMFIPHNKYESFVWLPTKPKTPRGYATLGHELLHATFHCMSWFGIGYCNKSEEAFTYLHTYFTENFLKQIKN